MFPRTEGRAGFLSINIQFRAIDQTFVNLCNPSPWKKLFKKSEHKRCNFLFCEDSIRIFPKVVNKMKCHKKLCQLAICFCKRLCFWKSTIYHKFENNSNKTYGQPLVITSGSPSCWMVFPDPSESDPSPMAVGSGTLQKVNCSKKSMQLYWFHRVTQYGSFELFILCCGHYMFVKLNSTSPFWLRSYSMNVPDFEGQKIS